MSDTDSLKDRVTQFKLLGLPGQPKMAHMGTVYLVNDLWQEIERLQASNVDASQQSYRINHDGFEGIQIGSYVTLEGKEGIVLQQHGTRVVHVYARKWATPLS